MGKVFDQQLGKFNLEPPVRLLLVRVLRLFVLALFFVMALQNLGIDLLPLIAGVGVAGAGIALAMQGVLGNLAAGLTIIFTRPFRVGEYVSMVGVEGRVETVDLFTTTLSHADTSLVIVPNRKIVGEILHNYGHIRQLDLTVGISRADDLADAAISIAIRPWVKVEDYGPAGAEINRAIVERFRAAGVVYPAPVPEMRVVRG